MHKLLPQRVRDTIIPLALLVLVFKGAPAAAQNIKDIETIDGNCTASSHTAEGPIGTDLTKKQSRFFCDAVSFGWFADSTSHILVQFVEKGSQHGKIIGFGGMLDNDGILHVRNLYLDNGMPPVTASEGYCKFFRRKMALESMACGAMVDEQGRRTVAAVGFEVSSSAHLRWPKIEDDRAQSSQLDCRKIIDLHGYLSRAQFQCGFKKYTKALIDDASVCNNRLPDREVRTILLHAMQDFDLDQHKLGSYRACKRILDNFGQFIAK